MTSVLSNLSLRLTLNIDDFWVTMKMPKQNMKNRVHCFIIEKQQQWNIFLSFFVNMATHQPPVRLKLLKHLYKISIWGNNLFSWLNNGWLLRAVSYMYLFRHYNSEMSTSINQQYSTQKLNYLWESCHNKMPDPKQIAAIFNFQFWQLTGR